MAQRYTEVRTDNRQKAGWKVVSVEDLIGYSIVRYERSGINDFDIILSASGVAKLSSHGSDAYLKEMDAVVEKNGMINPAYVLPQIRSGGEKILREVAIEVIEHHFGAHKVRVEWL